MATPIIIMGQSGTGKTFSLRNIPNNEYALINVLGKDLSFRSDKRYKETFNFNEIKASLLGYAKGGRHMIVIDDAGYLLTKGLVDAGNVKDIFKHYRDLAAEFWELIRFIMKELPKKTNVYIIMHEATDDYGLTKPKTVGKMLDDQIDIPGMVNILIRAVKQGGEHKFLVRGESNTVVKTPDKLFDTDSIPNDLKFVNDRINEYYFKNTMDINGEQVVNEVEPLEPIDDPIVEIEPEIQQTDDEFDDPLAGLF